MGLPPKGDWQGIVGRTIEAVICVERERTPHTQIHLLFSDGSTFEIYSGPCEYIGANRRLHRGNLPEVLSRIRPGVEVHVFAGEDVGRK